MDRFEKFKNYVKMRDFPYVLARIPVEYPQQPILARLWESVSQVYSEQKSALMHGHNGRINRGRLARTYILVL